MFGKAHRVCSREYTDVFKKGKKTHRDSFFVVSVQDEAPFRFAVSVPKKKAKRAVDRVRIRRQIYAALRENASVRTGAYIVIVKSVPIDVDGLIEVINTL